MRKNAGAGRSSIGGSDLDDDADMNGESGGRALRLAVEKSLDQLDPTDEAILLDRAGGVTREVADSVSAILAQVSVHGDSALLDLARRFDPATPRSLEVERTEWDSALQGLDPALRAALERSAGAIKAFHKAQIPPPLEVQVGKGVRLGRRAEPLRRVGVYAPGGRAAYPSSVLMGVIPARVAGVDEVVVCSPPGPDGLPPATVMAACALAGADRLFAIGGAGAVAALAYGTRTVPRVHKVVGPGNAYVTEAKRQLAGVVASDTPAGPSEILVVADESADAMLAAMELLAQAEHDPDAAVAIVTTRQETSAACRSALERLLPLQPREEVVREALAANGAVLTASDLDQALEFAERYAPEHLLLLVRNPRETLERVRAAGTIFLGPGSSVAFGDYLTGANHVLPTAGLARSFSGLSTLDFLRMATYQELDPEAAAEMAASANILATAEGLPAHALAARARAIGPEEAVSLLEGKPAEKGVKPAGEDSAPEESDAGPEGPSATPAGQDVKPVQETEDPAPGLAGRTAGSLDEPGLPRTATGTRSPTAVPLRSAYRTLELYDPERKPTPVDLSDNTSLFGPGPAAAQAVAELSSSQLTRYPPVFAQPLKEALAAWIGVDPSNITTGCGSDDVLDSAMRAFCETGDVVAFPEPTFSMVPIFARMNATRAMPVPLGRDFALDPDALLATRAPFTYVCRPNNPTGTLFPRDDVQRLVRDAAGVVVLDEAYADFALDSLARESADSDRLVVLGTLSKCFGLAGLRVGYAVGPAELIREIEKSRGPYKVNSAAEAAALAALRDDLEWARRNIEEVRSNRNRLAEELAEQGLVTWPSAANFLLMQVPEDWSGPGEGQLAKRFASALSERGVAVRPFPDLPQAGHCIRVSIGPWSLLQEFLEALRSVLAGSRHGAGAPERREGSGT